MDKTILRKQLIAARMALNSGQAMAASQAVCAHLAEWPVFQQAQTVLAYLAFANEVSLQALIDAHPEKVWALPRTLSRGQLVIHRYVPGNLERHSWGMMQPSADAPLVPLESIDLVLAPGVGFDKQGGRLGFGGGYYDRLLPQLEAVCIGISYHETCRPAVPTDEHDCRMEWLAVPDGLHDCRPSKNGDAGLD